jgi:hypothetical protein
MKFFSGVSLSTVLASLLFLGSEVQAAEKYRKPNDLLGKGGNIPRAAEPHVVKRAPPRGTKPNSPKYLNAKTKRKSS